MARPSARAAKIAHDEGFGARLDCYEVNGAHDQRTSLASLLLLFAPWPFFQGVYESYEAWAGSARGLGLAGMLACGISGLLFLGLGLWFGLPALLSRLRGNGAAVHLYANGVIAERLNGHLYSWPYERATVRYVIWQQPWESQLRDRPQLWVTFHQDGERICFDGLSPHDREPLSDLSTRLGGNAEPERIGELRSSRAPVPF